MNQVGEDGSNSSVTGKAWIRSWFRWMVNVGLSVSPLILQIGPPRY